MNKVTIKKSGEGIETNIKIEDADAQEVYFFIKALKDAAKHLQKKMGSDYKIFKAMDEIQLKP